MLAFSALAGLDILSDVVNNRRPQPGVGRDLIGSAGFVVFSYIVFVQQGASFV